VIPISNGVTTANVEFGNVQRLVSLPSNDKQYSARYDYQISSKDRFSARYIIENQSNPLGANASSAQGYRVDVPARAQNIALDYTRTFSSHVVNQARASYARSRVAFEGGTTGCTNATINTCAPFVQMSSGLNFSLFGMNNAFPQDRLVNNTQFQDNASWLIGKHLLKFGGEFDRQRSPSTFLPNTNGQFVFSDSPAGGPNAFSNLVMNRPSLFNLTDGPTKFNFKEKDAAWYVQDDWRIRQNLTLNLGLRYEWTQQAFNLLNALTVAQQTGPNPFWNTTLPPSVTTSPKIPEDYNNFGPRVGFAYTPHIFSSIFGQDKTVIRGGYGISYDIPYYNIYLNTAGSAPVVNAGQLVGIGVAPGIPANAATGNDIRTALLSTIPRGVNPGLRNYTTVNPKFHNPYVQQWTLGFERELNSKVAVEVRYLGNHGVGLFRSVDGNPSLQFLLSKFPSLIPAGVTPCADPTAPGFTGQYVNCANTNVFERNNGASSIYHSLQSSLRMRSWHNITSQAAYTWSHNIDTTSEVFTRTSVGQIPVGQNPFNPGAGERGRSGIDFPNDLAVTLTYDLPLYKSQEGFRGHAFGGWSMNWIYRYNSGAPWTPVQNVPARVLNGPASGSMCDPQANFVTGTDTCRPILVNPNAPFTAVGRITTTAGVTNLVSAVPGGPIITPNIGASGTTANLSAVHWVVNDTFAAQFLGSPFLGVGRDTQRGDYINNANLSIFKTTRVSERISLQFQTTAYNVFNREFLGQPGTNINSLDNPARRTFGSFGNWKFNSDGDGSAYVTSGGIGRRRLEFAMKVIF
jgi:hypothetical protein